MAGKKTGKRLLTWVLVLVMALSLLPLNALAAENGMPENTNPSIVKSEEARGAHLVKSATKDGDTYKIQLESWVTGKVEQTTGSAPLDIVLVLDQSGSMEGEKLSNLKAAVTNFVAAINADADAHNVEHRIAIVGFASNGNDGWDNADKWKNTGLFVNGVFKKYITYTSSGYYAVYALNQANSYYIMQPGLFENYAVKVSYDSQKDSWGYWEDYLFYKEWVAVTPKESEDDANNSHTQFYEWRESESRGLTDQDYEDALVSSNDDSIDTAISNLSASGATRASYGMEMANNVFKNNALRKGSSRVVVFFTDGEPGQKGYETNEAGRAIAQAYATKKTYDAKVFSVGMFDNPSTHVGKFMDYVSSNYPNANASSNYWGNWTITPGGKDADKYYMTVEDGDLSTVFKQISGSILTSDVKADANTVLTDTLSQYFDFDGVTVENGTVTGVTVQKQKYNGDGQAWGDPESVDNVSVALDPATKTVTVSGFDYSNKDNVVTDTPSGYKLVVTFNVKPDTSYTNWGASGEYETNNDKATLANGNDTFATVASPKAPVDTYQVTYKPGTGTGNEYIDQYYLNGAKTKVLENRFAAQEGYEFDCWKDENDTTYQVGDEITFGKSNVILTAQWKEIESPEPALVTLTANSKTVKYDGQSHDGSPYSCDALGLLPGHRVESVDYTCEPQTNVGEYDIELDNAKIVNADGNDVTDLYQITYNYGTLIIEPCDVTVTIKGNTGTYEYDGTEKTVEGYTANINNNLYTEADFKLVDSQAKIRATVPGTYQMGLKPENFENTNPNFNVTFVVKPDGKLTIENRPITITANDVTGKYNGQPHGENGYSITMGSLVDGHAATVTISGSKTDAGEYEELLVPRVTKIVDAKDKDVTSYYDISYEDGKLTINKRSVTLTSETASKVYDGTALTKPNVKVTGDGFVEGEVTDIRATGSVTHVSEGEVTNTITFTKGQKFKDSNYDITKNEGTLKITEASAPTPGTFDFNDVVYGDGKVTPAITKTVKGNVGRNFKETFKVTVEPKSDNAKNTMTPDYYTGKAEVIASKSLKDVPFLFKPEAMANAVVPYGKLRFTEAGTYTYTVQEEIPGGTSRMSYDTTEYTLKINVVLDEDSNTYQVKSWQFTPGNRENLTQLNIVNTYRTYHPSASSKPTLNTGDHYAYVMGYPDGTVRPNGSITRAEVSTILFRLLSDKTRDEYFTTESSFTDVKAGAWYNNSIATLEKAGVIVDTAKGGAFRPNEAITRAELAAMLAQFSDAKPVKGVKFSDVSAEHWAYEAIAIAAKMGWIEGYPDGTFRPDATITRAEMMTLVNRALDRVPSDEDHLLSKRVMLTFPDCKSGDWFYIAVQEATNSHTYERAATEKNGDEQWTALRANRDWTLLEK